MFLTNEGALLAVVLSLVVLVVSALVNCGRRGPVAD
jgi:predicted small lipoprotein YifL